MTDIFRTSQTVSALDPSKPHIVLVGLPGAGKSTVGAMLAQKLVRTFLDFDLEIERREGMPISQIFGERGEAGFRELERKLTEELREFGNMVLSPGGGWITDPTVVGLIRPPAKLVYLRVRPETALQRLGGSSGDRPLLNRPDPMAELNKLFQARQHLYQSADLEIGTELLKPEQVTEEIAAKFRF
ncbi:MAG TPA: shikimate kinase [Gemmatimonadaceae bacterium]|nr:shikimate kinase [Gemmatimonadaceae bacterium]